MRFAPAIFANLILLFAAIGYGGALRPLFPRRLRGVDRAALTVLGGLGLLGIVLFLAGQVRLSPTVIVVALFPAIWGGILVARLLRANWTDLFRVRPQLLPTGIVAVVLLICGIAGLAAPTGDISTLGLKNDSIAYHFLGPRVWLRDQIIRPVPDESLTAMPALVETDYSALMSIGGSRAPGLFVIVQLGALLLIAAGLALRLGLTGRETWWALALIAAIPVVCRGSTGGDVDGIYSAFVLIALRLILDLECATSWILLAIFGGFAMATKYTGMMAWILLAVCASFAALWVLKLPFSRALKRVALATAIAASIAAPWYVRNWVLLGSPIYPPPLVLLRWFHVRYLGSAAVRSLQDAVLIQGNGMGRTLADFFLLPFHITMHPGNFLDIVGGIGLVPLALSPFSLIVYRRDARAAVLGAFVALQVVAWFVSEQDGRFFIHILVLAAIAGVAGWGYVVRVSRRSGYILGALVVAVSVSYGMVMIVRNNAESGHATLSKRFEQERTEAEIPFLDSFEYLNGNPSVRKILFLNPNIPAYYSRKSYLKAFGRWGEVVVPGADTVPQVLARVGELHITHILDVRWPGGKFDVPTRFPGLELVFNRGDQRIYRVTDRQTDKKQSPTTWKPTGRVEMLIDPLKTETAPNETAFTIVRVDRGGNQLKRAGIGQCR